MRYWVAVNGRGLRLKNAESINEPYGFYVVRAVRGETEREAIDKAIRVVSNEVLNKFSVDARPNVVLFARWIAPIPWFRWFRLESAFMLLQGDPDP